MLALRERKHDEKRHAHFQDRNTFTTVRFRHDEIDKCFRQDKATGFHGREESQHHRYWMALERRSHLCSVRGRDGWNILPACWEERSPSFRSSRRKHDEHWKPSGQNHILCNMLKDNNENDNRFHQKTGKPMEEDSKPPDKKRAAPRQLAEMLACSLAPQVCAQD